MNAKSNKNALKAGALAAALAAVLLPTGCNNPGSNTSPAPPSQPQGAGHQISAPTHTDS